MILHGAGRASRGKLCKDLGRFFPNLYEHPLDALQATPHSAARAGGKARAFRAVPLPPRRRK
nr:MAG TPA: hypothetical protein [Inoviridae sp.]